MTHISITIDCVGKLDGVCGIRFDVIEEMDTILEFAFENDPLTVEVHCALVSARYPWLKRCNERIVEAVIDLIEAKAREEEEKGLDTLYVLQNASGGRRLK